MVVQCNCGCCYNESTGECPVCETSWVAEKLWQQYRDCKQLIGDEVYNPYLARKQILLLAEGSKSRIKAFSRRVYAALVRLEQKRGIWGELIKGGRNA